MRHLGRHMRIGLAAALATCAAALAPRGGIRRRRLRPAARGLAARRQRLHVQADRGAPGAGRPRARHLRGRGRQLGDRVAEVQGRRLLRLRARVRQPGHRRHRRLGRPAGALRRRGARRRPERAGFRWSGHSQGGMMPRYYLKFLGGASKVDDLVGLAPSNHGTDNPARPRRGRDVLPRLRPAARRLALPREPQRGRRDPGLRLLHADRDALRRGRHAVHLGLPRPRPPDGQHPAPGRLPGRGDRPPRDAQRRARDPLGPAGARAPGSRGPDAPAELHLARSWTNPAGWWPAGLDVPFVLPRIRV